MHGARRVYALVPSTLTTRDILTHTNAPWKTYERFARDGFHSGLTRLTWVGGRLYRGIGSDWTMYMKKITLFCNPKLTLWSYINTQYFFLRCQFEVYFIEVHFFIVKICEASTPSLSTDWRRHSETENNRINLNTSPVVSLPWISSNRIAAKFI